MRTLCLSLVPIVLWGCVRAPVVARAASSSATVSTVQGELVGNVHDGVREFLGVPYAAPPVAALRWKAPVPATSWATPRDATRRGPACSQLPGGETKETSEDCLSLNVWAPEGVTEPMPVMVWIHGGAFVGGSGADNLYDGARLATRARAVVVTLNYRLGVFGFLSLPELAKEWGRAASPSVGLLDQRAALQWVQQNIAHFGGDPARVMLFGNSAGAWSVCSHLASPSREGLFSRALMQSGACSNALYFTPAVADQQGEALAKAVGCTGPERLACLRNTPVEKLLTALPMKRGQILTPGVWWGPVVDGTELPKMPLTAFREGTFVHVPLVIGWNRDEGIVHTASFKTVTTEEAQSFVRDSFGEKAATQMPAHYPRPTPKDMLNDVITDAVFACGARQVARVLSAQGVPVFQYQWMHPLDDERVHAMGATHSIELFFVFGNVSLGFGVSEAERPLSNQVMDAWAAFARSGNPSTAALPWPQYSAEGDALLLLDTVPSPTAGVKAQPCDFWDPFLAP